MPPSSQPRSGMRVAENSIAVQRTRIGETMITGAFTAIKWSAIGIVAAVVTALVLSWQAKVDQGTVQLVLGYLDRFIGAIIPLFAAWVGAVIAFYFARDNFDAATENTKALVGQMAGVDLSVITVEETMIRRAQMTVATTEEDGPRKLKSQVLPRFLERGLSRFLILDKAGKGVGVLRNGYVSAILMDPPERFAKGADEITLKDLLDDGPTRDLLAASTVYAARGDTLAAVRRKMQEASRRAPRTVRDVFVTEDGTEKTRVIGYLADLDIAEKARLPG